MKLECRPLPLPKDASGMVVRPRPRRPDDAALDGAGSGDTDGSGDLLPYQVLLFLGDEVCELLPSPVLNGGQPPFCLGPMLKLHSGGSSGAGGGSSGGDADGGVLVDAGRHALYEPTSGCVYYTEGHTMIMRLDGRNVVHAVAGADPAGGRGWRACCCGLRRAGRQRAGVRQGRGGRDGLGPDARFAHICAMAADGKGNIFVAEAGCIRRLDVSSGEVSTLQRSAPPAMHWTALSYDHAACVLVAATPYAVCHLVLTADGGAVTPAVASPPRLVAGSWGLYGRDDGMSTAARFYNINVMLAGVARQLYIADATLLRTMDEDAHVRTLVSGCLPYCSHFMAALPTGDLAVGGFSYTDPRVMFVCGGAFAPSSPALGGWPDQPNMPTSSPAVELFRLLSLPMTTPTHAGTEDGGHQHRNAPAGSGVGGDSGGGSAGQMVQVVVGGGRKTFVAHGSVLAAHSGLFRQLLTRPLEPGGDVSGAGNGSTSATAAIGKARTNIGDEVRVPDAHPDAFGWLLAYMYCGDLAVPDELLRPAVELAALLQLPAACLTKLQARLLAIKSTRGSVSVARPGVGEVGKLDGQA